MVSSHPGLVLLVVVGFLLVFQAPDSAIAALQKGGEEVDVNGISVVTEVGKGIGGRKMALMIMPEELNTESTGNDDEIASNGSVEEDGSQVRLLEEVMQVMRRDYGGFTRPKRKPPIPN